MDNKGARILIVEDDQFLRDFYQELLESEGYIIQVAADGLTASQLIHEGGWNLILLDLMLPQKDGVTLLRELQSNPPEKANGSIVVLTNLGNDNVINQCFALGASGYLIKSALNPDQVLSEIHAFIKV